ncbi:MAG: exonuclease domain-containing protein, partial [Chloroflexota bacterium]
MSLKSDYIIVIDMEATCWRSNRRPPDQVSEIIEIGVCVLDLDTLEPDRKMSILVKPTLSTVSEFCTRLTSLTQAQVDK